MIGRRLVGSIASIVLLSGCGAAAIESSGSQIPSLDVSLTTVDSSLAHGQYAVARASLLRLMAQARAAESNGSISQLRAAQILNAARELLRLLPPSASATPTSTIQAPTPSSTPTATPTKTATRKPKPQPTPTVQPTPAPSLPPPPTPTPSPTETVSPAALASPSP